MASHGYDGFISYSTAADRELAPRIQEGLEQLAKPWNKRRALRIFQDVDDLAASADLESALGSELAQSNTMVFLASEESAASPWCAAELEYWLRERRPEQLVVVLTGGTLEFDPDRDPPTVFERSTSAPPAFEALATVPLYVDMRYPDRDVRSLHHRHDPDFRAKLSKIAAAIHSNVSGETVAPRDIDSADLREFRRSRRLRRLAVSLLVVLAVLASVLAWVADQRRRDAEDLARAADARALAANSAAVRDFDPELAALLAIESASVDDGPDARTAMFESAVDPWRATVLRDVDFVTSAVVADGGERVFATRGGGDPALLIDVATGDVLIEFVGRSAEAGDIAPAGDLFATAGFDGATLWAEDGTVLRDLDVFAATTIRFDPTGRRVLTAGDDGVLLHDVDGGAPTVLTNTPAAFAVMSADGRRVVASILQTDAEPSDVTTWELDESGAVLATAEFTLPPDPLDPESVIDQVNDADFDPLTGRLVVARGRRVVVWNTDGSVATELVTDPAQRAQAGPLVNDVTSVDVDAAGRIVTGGFQETRVWDLTFGTSVALPGSAVASMDLSRDRTTLVTLDFDAASLWEIAGDDVTPVPVPIEDLDFGPVGIRLSADGSRALTQSFGTAGTGALTVWDRRGVPVWRQDTVQTRSAVVDRTGSSVVVTNLFGAQLFDVADDTDTGIALPSESGEPALGDGPAAIDPNGEIVAIPTYEAIDRWEIVGPDPVRLPSVPVAGAVLVAVAPSGSPLAVRRRVSVELEGSLETETVTELWWDDGRQPVGLETGEIVGMVFAGDGDHLVTWGESGVVRWPIGGGEPERIVAASTTGYSESIDGSRFVTSGRDGSVLWAADGALIAVLDASGRSSATLSAGGNVAATSSVSGVNLWRVWDDDELVAELGSRVGSHPISPLECANYSVSSCAGS